ncbi:MAG: hypothetical protein PWQ95_1319 [Thermococcaceae archaeon]|nr:hypothetical protein [Thermococcaceae archaeon]
MNKVDLNLRRVYYLSCINSLFILSFYLLITPTAPSYEVSIYSQTPLGFWILVIFLLVVSQISLNFKEKKLPLIPVIVLLLVDSYIFVLPYLRGYFMYGREDPMTHIGLIKYMLISAHNYPLNFYPIFHIFGAILALISDLKIYNLTFFVPSISFLLFALWSLILWKTLHSKRDSIKFIISILFVPLFGFWTYLMVPNMFSFYLIPLVLFVWITNRTNKKKKHVLIIIFFLLMMYLHPVTTMYLLITFLLLDLSVMICDYFKICNPIRDYDYLVKSPYIIVLLLILFGSWYTSFKVIIYSLKGFVYSLLLAHSGNPFLEQYKTQLQWYNLHILRLLEWGMIRYGIILTLSTVIVVRILNILKRYKKITLNLDDIEFAEIFSYVGFLFFGIWTAITMFTRFLNYERVVKYLIFFSLVPFATQLKQISTEKKSRKVFIIPLILLVFDAIAIYSVYPSPLMGAINQQVSHSEYVGMNWFFEHKSKYIQTRTQLINQFRFYDAIYGTMYSYPNVYYSPKFYVPIHYDYRGTDSYFVIENDIRAVFYSSLIPEKKEFWKYTPEDFRKLIASRDINIAYSDKSLIILLYHHRGD